MLFRSQQSIRIAPFNGNISWNTVDSVESKDMTFSLQTQRIGAIISKLLYHPWRISVRFSYNIVGRVISEFSDEIEARNCFDKFRNEMLKDEPFVENITYKEINEGDVISVPTAMGSSIGMKNRHFGVVIKEGIKYFVIEYQGESKRGSKVSKTPILDFIKRVEINFPNFQLKRHIYIKELEGTCTRALRGLDKSDYHVLMNNCETFASFCKTGKASSGQITRIFEKVVNLFEVLSIGIIGAAAIVVVVSIILKDAQNGQCNEECQTILNGILVILSTSVSMEIASGVVHQVVSNGKNDYLKNN